MNNTAVNISVHVSRDRYTIIFPRYISSVITKLYVQLYYVMKNSFKIKKTNNEQC